MRHYGLRKRVLVTGGAGFLGSHLVDRLLGLGHEVVCADNLFTGTKANLEHLHGHPRFEFIRHDVTVPLYVEVDEIWNLACPASPIHYQHDPLKTLKTSVIGAMNMLGLARRLKFSRHDDPDKVERDLEGLFPIDRWTFLHHALILHGRRVCHARGPACQACSLAADCPTASGASGRPRR
jgi:hypothetical protein